MLFTVYMSDILSIKNSSISVKCIRAINTTAMQYVGFNAENDIIL